MTPRELINARRLLNVTQAELALSLGVTVRTVNRWEAEAGKHPVPKVYAILIRLALLYPDARKLMEMPERRGPNAEPRLITRPDHARS
jgi:DNA-binding XRE family transcriptional regulator